ncbi:phosphate acyltransferase [Lentisphaerota bacterium ZTH]|nr:phosphate acetytransferase [Lentisphaerota bacterium]WET05919.1 phosphate acyltransferase [Lentisphaerota bacterium ZTH]
MLKSLETFVELAKKKKDKKIALAAAEDSHALKAIKLIIENEIAQPVLVGNTEKIKQIAANISLDLEGIEVIDEKDVGKACMKAVKIVKEGGADVLMRGLVDSTYYLKAILNKEHGLKKTKLVSQVAFIESPHYHKVFAYTDSGINIAPDLADKTAMIKQAVEAFHKLGIKKPKVGVIAAVESVKEAIPATVEASVLSMINYRGGIKGCIVEGPISIDLAFSKESCEHKGLETRVGGDVDLIVLPEINSANVFYKTMTFLGGAQGASFITGTTAPCVFPSRSDSVETKYYAMACAVAQCE